MTLHFAEGRVALPQFRQLGTEYGRYRLNYALPVRLARRAQRSRIKDPKNQTNGVRLSRYRGKIFTQV